MNWAEFYRNRVGNKEYEDYFKKRYSVFLSFLKKNVVKYSSILECGCGTGLVTKLIREDNKSFSISDLDENMLKIASKSIGKIDSFRHNILNPIKSDVIVTHGVLEHFTPNEIKRIVDIQSKNSKLSIHYVPTDKYKYRSYGNELLIRREDWQNLTKPQEIIEFNNGHDLIITIGGVK